MSIIKICSECGQELKEQPEPPTPESLGYKPVARTVHMSLLSPTGDTFKIPHLRSYETSKPAIRPGTNAHVWVSFGQAFFTGFFSCIVSIFAAVYWSWYWWTPVFVWSIVSLFTWLVSQDFYRRQMMETQSVVIDPPPPPPQAIEHTVKIIDEKQKTTSYVKVNIDPEKMREVATAALLPGGTFSRNYLCKERKILTQPEYKKLRQIFLDQEIIREMPNKSNVLTRRGRWVLDSYRRK